MTIPLCFLKFAIPLPGPKLSLIAGSPAIFPHSSWRPGICLLYIPRWEHSLEQGQPGFLKRLRFMSIAEEFV